jgi:hypothetical protein
MPLSEADSCRTRGHMSERRTPPLPVRAVPDEPCHHASSSSPRWHRRSPLLHLPTQVPIVALVRSPDVELGAMVSSSLALASKVPDPSAPKKGSPVSYSPSPCPPCSTSSPTTARRAGHRQPRSRRSPWARFARAGHGSKNQRAAGAESQLGHDPPWPNVVVGHTCTLCASGPAKSTHVAFVFVSFLNNSNPRKV